MIITNGNMLESPVKIWLHQVNCKGVMGAGIAKQIRNIYPEVYSQYKADLAAHGDLMLGCFSMAETKDGKIIFSVFGQDSYGRGELFTSYPALQNGIVASIEKYRSDHNVPEEVQIVAAIPYKIGCGLGGGDWEKVRRILETVESVCNMQFIAYKLS